MPTMIKVILFKDSGKYYTEEEWRLPTKSELSSPGDIWLPNCMINSPDFRRIGNGKVLVLTQEPWRYPGLI